MDENAFRNLSDIIGDVIGICRQSSEAQALVTGLSTGFFDLDYVTRGLHKGELILLEGEPRTGKTSLALSIVYHAIAKENVTTALFSPALSDKQVMMRILSMDSDIFYGNMRNGLRDQEGWKRLEQSAERIMKAPLYIDDRACITVNDIRSSAIKLKADGKLGLIVVDYLQMLSNKEYIDVNTKSNIACSLKKLALEMDCPVLVISEIMSSEGWERIEGCRLSDKWLDRYAKLHADLIMNLRLNYQECLTDLRICEEGEVTVIKNRNGINGKVRLTPDLGHFRFVNRV